MTASTARRCEEKRHNRVDCQHHRLRLPRCRPEHGRLAKHARMLRDCGLQGIHRRKKRAAEQLRAAWGGSAPRRERTEEQKAADLRRAWGMP
eukprot:CAMPEP_0118865946 /NCGR_PEP_ID=MMETSP1163-20130328/10030_1 /TAXON_ID=124430 /ORGANISM="Phaeomonas parva, Strain CCMP2877" /LENGTH=91 /DNA_ID=CAMNT_0006800219 /DNA_START=550 /DNA_END=825 /DNA_ORIENTATION=+